MRLGRRQPARPRRRLRRLRLLLLLSALGVLASTSFAYGLVNGIASEIPELDPSRAQRVEELGYIYAGDGKTVLAVLRGSESRIVVPSERIARVMKRAVVAVEDRRFWEHGGIDLRGIARAFVADVREQDVVQGGSTITQQLVKNAYRQNERSLSRKLKESLLAWQLERRWPKDRILTAYLNTVYFGNGAYGVEMASRTYFRTNAAELTLAEAALLAGIPANPSGYDPVSNPEAARKRRDSVLEIMLEEGLIEQRDFVRASRAPLPAPDRVRLPVRARGPAPYFAEYVKQQLVRYYGPAKVFGGGLRVYTSIDLDLQAAAQKAIAKWLRGIGPAAALVAVDARDGRVLAMVGGENFGRSQFNLAAQGRRQAGSSFKPFVLAAALAKGISPATVFESEPTFINLGGRLWSVSNYEDSYLGAIDVEQATIYSDNAVFAQLTALAGPENVRRIAKALGMTSRLEEHLSIGLGAEEVNPLEMARAFSSFAANGARIDGALLGNVPRAVLRVEDGDRVDANEPVPKQVLDPNDAALVTAMLRKAVEEGTGRAATLGGRPVAGKTGTTENHGDAWFVGYTPQVAAAVWVGYPSRVKPMLSEFHGEPVAGGTYPALIWRTFMKTALALANAAPEDFPPASVDPAAPYRVVHRNGGWLLDNGYCRNAREVLYFAGFEPEEQAACKPNEVAVPRVVGARVDQARELLAAVPLTTEVILRPARGGERLGLVVAQYPRRGTLSAWDSVKIVVPKALHGTVPRVVGLDVDEARARLDRRRLEAAIDGHVPGEPAVVLAQSPVAGRAAVPGLPVRLVVGSG